jgi:hypothetical protein
MARQTTRSHVGPHPRTASTAAVQLAWARDREGRKVRADRLTPASRRTLAPFSCLACAEPLIPHLGRIRAPHFAHRAGSPCPLTAPETALHLDAKERLLARCADAFAGRRRLLALARCPACRRVQPIDVAARGDRAVDEGAVGPLRADVLVLRGDRPAFAFEVKVTHAVEPEKEAALAAAGVPAVEIDAREEWEREGGDAVELVCARSFGLPPCPACQVRARADAERDLGGEAAEIAELEGYRARGLFRAARLLGRGADGEAALTREELASVTRAFRCPDCDRTTLAIGTRLVKHVCDPGPDAPASALAGRPVAWRTYGGELVTLGWWAAKATGGAGRSRRAARKPR